MDTDGEAGPPAIPGAVALPGPEHPPEAANGFHAGHARLLVRSFRRLAGRELIPLLTGSGEALIPPEDLGRRLFAAPFAVLSHGPGSDPRFTYGNGTALALFEVTWAELLAMPSRLSAEPLEQAERTRLLARVRDHGFIDDYSGVRISRCGRRFRIRRAVVWTLLDDAGAACGQAAAFADWQFLP